jgi:hypothetical protein
VKFLVGVPHFPLTGLIAGVLAGALLVACGDDALQPPRALFPPAEIDAAYLTRVMDDLDPVRRH